MLTKRWLYAGLVVMVQAAYASPDSPEESIRQFYTAATAAEKDCAAAMRLRPGFPEERCQKLQAATIRSLQELSNDGTNAAVAADIQVTSNDKPQAFKGTIHLQREQGEWLLKSFDDGKAGTTSKVIPLSTEADIIEAANPAPTLAMLHTRFPDYAKGKIALVDVDQQRLTLYEQDQEIASFPVSTATNGAGNLAGSDQTPLGAHIVSEKFGDTAELGTIFESRKDTGKKAEILTNPEDVPTDHVTTRILWLDGLEPNKNKGGEVDSKSRFIYIHGTPEEGLIGKPASHGCIRMKNADVIKVYELLEPNTLVYIGK